MVSKSRAVKNVITIAACEGGLTAVSRLVKALNCDIDAAVFIVLELSGFSKADTIRDIIQKNTAMTCLVAVDLQPIVNKTIYLAPSGHYLLIKDEMIRVISKAAGNDFGLSIDLLFHSAGVAYGSGVAGVILTGFFDHAASGMIAIKQYGGKCIVQDPDEASFPEMPGFVLRAIDVDFVLPVDQIGQVLSDLFTTGCSCSV